MTERAKQSTRGRGPSQRRLVKWKSQAEIQRERRDNEDEDGRPVARGSSGEDAPGEKLATEKAPAALSDPRLDQVVLEVGEDVEVTVLAGAASASVEAAGAHTASASVGEAVAGTATAAPEEELGESGVVGVASKGVRCTAAKSSMVYGEDKVAHARTYEAALVRPHTTGGGKSNLHPVVASSSHILDSIRLIKADDFLPLTPPWPRCQDLPSCAFGTPMPDDIVVAVSHGWRNQTHPDPNGRKHAMICKHLEHMMKQNICGSSIYLFLDFVSIPQRPFETDQLPRSEEDMAVFSAALKQMHNMYFLADFIVHLPFHSESIAGEGTEYSVFPEALMSSDIRQVGACWQVVGGTSSDWRTRWSHISWRGDQIIAVNRSSSGSRRTPDHRSATVTTSSRASKFGAAAERFGFGVRKPVRKVGLYDQLLAITDGDGRRKEFSLEDLQATWQDKAAQLSRTVEVRCWPFGQVNLIPTDDRGWVFLERFITAVKCAMLPGDRMAWVVITDAPTIDHQILNSAKGLQAAAKEDNDRNDGDSKALRAALDGFLVELKTKRFSGASTDKLLLSAAGVETCPDSVIVADIMKEFVEHLAGHWEAEALKQRRQFGKMDFVIRHAADYLLVWDSFSDARVAEIDRAANTSIWVIVALVILPVILPLAVCMIPWEHPSRPLHEQRWFFGALVPISGSIFVFIASYCFAFALEVAPRRRHTLLKMAGLAGMVALALDGLAAILIFSTGLFPFPFFEAVIGLIGSMFMPAMWLIMPRWRRNDAAFRRKAIAIVASYAIMLVAVCGVLPCLNALMLATASPWIQAFILLLYLVVKLSYERITRCITFNRVGADMMPCYVFVSAMAYELNLCSVLSSGFSVWQLLELLVFDLVANIHHAWSLYRLKLKQPDSQEGRGRLLLIMAELQIREWMEVSVRGVFLVVMVCVRYGNPRFNDLVCKMDDKTFRTMIAILAVDFGSALLVASLTSAFLVFHGFAPLRVLRGIVGVFYKFFAAASVALWLFFFGFQLTHVGMDFSLRFAWLRDPQATWVCGLKWELP